MCGLRLLLWMFFLVESEVGILCSRQQGERWGIEARELGRGDS